MTGPSAGPFREADEHPRPQLDVDALPDASAAEEAAARAAAGIPAAPPPGAPNAAAATRPAAAKKPGVERWRVKTGIDADVGLVQSKVVKTTVEELVAVARPGGAATLHHSLQSNHREGGAERTIWRIEADITLLKVEDDGDYHLVLRGDSGVTMIGEVPDPRPAFVKPASPWRAAIRSARAAVDAHLTSKITTAFVPILLPAHAATAPGMTAGTAPGAAAAEEGARPPVLLVRRHFPPAPAAAPGGAPTGPLVTPTDPNVPQPLFSTKIDARARITGVGFFDRVHGQTGVAKNGLELHPILKIVFL